MSDYFSDDQLPLSDDDADSVWKEEVHEEKIALDAD